MQSPIPSKDQRSGTKSHQSRNAGNGDVGQPRSKTNWLANDYIVAICGGCTIPPIVIAACVAQLNLTATVVITAYVSLIITYAFTVMSQMHTAYRLATYERDKLREDVAVLSIAYNRALGKLQHRNAVPITIKRTGKNAVAGSSGVSTDPATVVAISEE